MTYETFVQAISERDIAQLGSMMEPNLRNSFVDLFETLDEENCEIIAHNLENPTPTRIRIIDFVQILGASVNRT